MTIEEEIVAAHDRLQSAECRVNFERTARNLLVREAVENDLLTKYRVAKLLGVTERAVAKMVESVKGL